MKYLFTALLPVLALALTSCLQQQQQQQHYGPECKARPDESFPERKKEAEARLQKLQSALTKTVAAIGSVESAPEWKETFFPLSAEEVATLKDCLSRAKAAPMKHAYSVHPSPPPSWEYITLKDADGNDLFTFTPFKVENNGGFEWESHLESPQNIAAFIRPNLSLPDADKRTILQLPTVQKMLHHGEDCPRLKP